MTNTSDSVNIQIALKADEMRSDLVRGLVWFVNYAAIDPSAVKVEDLDLHGCAMLPQDVEKFAHRWLAFSRSIDINHDGIGRNVHVVESFMNTPDIGAAAWPINAHAARLDVAGDKEAFDGLKSGKLNSVSLDALTFNRVVRLPVAEAMKMVDPNHGQWSPPTDRDGWARELAQDGYEGVTDVRRIAPDMWLVSRGEKTPLAVSMKDGYLETTAAGGAWGHVGAMLIQSPTLKAIGPEEDDDYSVAADAGPASVSPWSPQAVRDALAAVGVNLTDSAFEQFQRHTDAAYALHPSTTAVNKTQNKAPDEQPSYFIGDLPGNP